MALAQFFANNLALESRHSCIIDWKLYILMLGRISVDSRAKVVLQKIARVAIGMMAAMEWAR